MNAWFDDFESGSKRYTPHELWRNQLPGDDARKRGTFFEDRSFIVQRRECLKTDHIGIED